MHPLLAVVDIIMSTMIVCVGSYYLWRNRDNQSYLRLVLVLIVGSVAIDALYTTYDLLCTVRGIMVSGSGRSATILIVKAAIGALCSVLAFCPDKCELPAVHHLMDTDIRKCVPVTKETIAYPSRQFSEVG